MGRHGQDKMLEVTRRLTSGEYGQPNQTTPIATANIGDNQLLNTNVCLIEKAWKPKPTCERVRLFYTWRMLVIAEYD